VRRAGVTEENYGLLDFPFAAACGIQVTYHDAHFHL